MTDPTIPADLKTDNYDYDLPKELIAQQPLRNREDAKLISVDRGQSVLEHLHVSNLRELLRPGDCLVLNDTKVVPARLSGLREKTGGRWQGLFLESDESGHWRVMAKTRGRIKPGETVMLEDRDAVPRLQLTLLSKLEGGQWIVRPESPPGESLSAEELLNLVGRIPLPHYIRGGKMTDADVHDYQTIYARHPGAVAAPTAGLHLTQELVASLIDQGVMVAAVTLHVGIGTFRPVKTESLDAHEMHVEWGRLSESSVARINESRNRGGRIVAVGTTSMRVLESAALECGGNELQAWEGETNLFIKPGHEFRAVDALLTNFHLPRSTLLVLVRTFGGDELIRRAYEEAVQHQYRFYSYGDAMLIH